MEENLFNIRTIHHPAFAAAELEKTIAFWRDLLRFKLVASLGREGERQYFFSLPGGPTLTFFEWPRCEKPPKKRHGEPLEGEGCFDHVAFEVGSMEDLSALQNLLIDNSFAASDIVDHGFLFSLYSFDPNNIPIEFVYPKPGRDLYQNPLLKDPAPSPAAARENSPPPYEPDPAEEVVIVKGEWSQFFED